MRGYLLNVFSAVVCLLLLSGGLASATTTLRALDLRCVQAGVADVRVTGTLHLGPKSDRAHQLRGTLAIDIVKNDLAGQRTVLAERVMVSGEYSIDAHDATAAALDHDAIAVVYLGFARGAKSYIEHEGIRYPTICELKRP